MPNLESAIGPFLKSLRENRKLSKYRLSEMTTVTRQRINDYELRRKVPTLGTLEKLSIALEYPVWKMIKKIEVTGDSSG